MKIKELTINEFEEFVSQNPLASHYQTSNYALLMSELGYDYELIGMVTEYGNIVAASLILLKKITAKLKYGYAPKGLILDYFNQSLLKEFSQLLKEYYKKKKVIFIKINPEIAIAQLDNKNFTKTYNWNTTIKDQLEEIGYLKLKDNIYFESILPRFNGMIDLKKTKINQYDKNTRNKIKRAINKGLEIETAQRSGIDILYQFLKNQHTYNEFYYKDYYNVFHKNDMIDLFLVSINTKDYLLKSKEAFEIESEINTKLNRELIKNNSQKNINNKMNSDRKLLSYKNDILEATERNSKHEKIYIGGALVIKYQNRVQIIASGYDKKFKRFNPNYFLHHKIIEYYKNDYNYLDLNGMSGDFTKDSPYYGLNKFKLGFHPNIYEFIGEFDFIINQKKYKKLLSNGTLAKIFNKKKKEKKRED